MFKKDLLFFIKFYSFSQINDLIYKIDRFITDRFIKKQNHSFFYNILSILLSSFLFRFSTFYSNRQFTLIKTKKCEKNIKVVYEYINLSPEKNSEKGYYYPNITILETNTSN